MLGGWCPLGLRMWRMHWIDVRSGIRTRAGQIWKWRGYGIVDGALYVWYVYGSRGQVLSEGVSKFYSDACDEVEERLKERAPPRIKVGLDQST